MFDDACYSWTEMFLCHSIEIRLSLERLYQSSSFFPHCKGKSMTYLEMDNIFFSRLLLFLKYSPHPMIAGFLLTRYIRHFAFFHQNTLTKLSS